MVRRHGWQLPAHTLQVAAITVFFLLAIAYYIFLAPFLWFNSLVIAAYAVYSPVAFAVFILYVRCTGINPADPGVIDNQQSRKEHEKEPSESSLGNVPGPLGIGSSLNPSVPSSVAPSVKGTEHKEISMEEGQLRRQRPPRICSCAGLCGLLCGWMVASDDCCRFSEPPQPVMEDEILFCTLCNAEVRRFSKHCRSCDKCVDGFDHHCRWLNNCIGKKNYRTFVALMSTSLMLLIVEGIVGTAVFVRCFVDRHRIGEQVMDKLGNGFTRAPFAAVVAVCTVVALLACIPLGELFFFHLILIKKGITTYEYVVAVRAQPGESPIEEEVITSTSGSTAPGMSRSSSLGLQQHGGWCTPPRIFVEHQDEAIPPPAPGTLPATVQAEQQNNPQKSKPGNVRISAWRLAKLNKAEATLAAANARKASSVLRPKAQAPDLKVLSDSDESYTSDSSRHSSVSTGFGTPLPLQKNGEDVKSSMSLSPYKSELPRIRTGREPAVITSWTKSLGMDLKSSSSQSDSSSKSSFVGRQQVDTVSKLSISSISSALREPEAAHSSTFVPHPVGPSGSRANTVVYPKVARAIGATLSDGYEASAGETTDDMRRSGKGRMMFSRAGTKLSPAGSASGTNFGNRAEASRYSGANNPVRTLQFGGRGISTSVLSAYQSRPSRRAPSSSTSSTSETEPGPFSTLNPSTGLQTSQRFSGRQTGNLQINEPSIFFSSPLIPIGESSRRHQSTGNLPPRPPVSLRSGIPGHTGPGSSSRSNSRLVSMLPSHTLDPIDR
ncbi:hypothetical protein M758_5G012700 [Ceratodon purpureus]|nr:hypothetical protein M758_5G012700 [Ceratodon purpureus]